MATDVYLSSGVITGWVPAKDSAILREKTHIIRTDVKMLLLKSILILVRMIRTNTLQLSANDSNLATAHEKFRVLWAPSN